MAAINPHRRRAARERGKESADAKAAETVIMAVMTALATMIPGLSHGLNPDRSLTWDADVMINK